MGTSVFHHAGGDVALVILPELDPSGVRSSPPFLLSVSLVTSLPLSGAPIIILALPLT